MSPSVRGSREYQLLPTTTIPFFLGLGRIQEVIVLKIRKRAILTFLRIPVPLKRARERNQMRPSFTTTDFPSDQLLAPSYAVNDAGSTPDRRRFPEDLRRDAQRHRLSRT